MCCNTSPRTSKPPSEHMLRMVCGFKRKICTSCSHETKAGAVKKLCFIHYCLYNASQKRKAKPQAKISDEKRLANNAFRVKAHADEWRKIFQIVDPEIKLIATALLRFRDNKRVKNYLIVNDVINSLTIPKITYDGIAENINFGSSKELTKRTQRNTKNASAVIGKVIDAMKLVFPGCTRTNVKMLHSSAHDIAQDTHTDYNYGAILERVRSFKDYHYSAIIAIEEGSHLLVGKERVKIVIPKNSMLFWRGDLPHAGGGYEKPNKRIFVSISSRLCPVSDSVYLVK